MEVRQGVAIPYLPSLTLLAWKLFSMSTWSGMDVIGAPVLSAFCAWVRVPVL